MREAVKKRLGYDPFFPSSDKTIIARVRRELDVLRGEVELLDEHGVQIGLRELSAPAGECGELIRAMALTISIAIDPKSAETYEQGPSEERAETPKRHEEPKEAPQAPATSVAGRAVASNAPVEPLRWSLGVGPVTALGIQPSPTLGVLGFATARYRDWSLGVEGELDLPRTTREQSVELHTSSVAARLVPCWHYGVAFLCQVSALRSLRATSRTSNASGSALAFAAGGRMGAELELSGALGALAYGELLGNLAPPRVLSDGRELWRTPLFSGALGFAFVVRFP